MSHDPATTAHRPGRREKRAKRLGTTARHAAQGCHEDAAGGVRA